MKSIFFLISTILLIFPSYALANYDPRVSENNRFGIHILFPDEISEASSLVNSNGGDWGYITIPIRASDKDLEKWQFFMDNCKRYHIIPIVRLATDGDYFNNSSWSRPTDYDILDFANFLNSLSWPTKNRYVIIFNEVNRADEWGGSVNPQDYAQILDYSTQIFKEKNSDFFILMAGLDNASANISDQSMNEYTFMEALESSDPGIYSKLDGIASHSYPNPAFSQPPNFSQEGVYSFYFQKQFADSYSGKNLPVFITETGWDSEKISQSQQAQYYIQSFNNFWNDKNVIAVTPFVFNAPQGDFSKFSFKINEQKSEIYQNYLNFKKIKGQPELSSDFYTPSYEKVIEPIKVFNNNSKINNVFKTINNTSEEFFKWLLKI